MANPVVTTNKSSYLPGEIATITVDYDPRVTVFTGTDQDGNTGTVTVTAGSAILTAPGKTVTKVSDNGTVATFTVTV